MLCYSWVGGERTFSSRYHMVTQSMVWKRTALIWLAQAFLLIEPVWSWMLQLWWKLNGKSLSSWGSLLKRSSLKSCDRSFFLLLSTENCQWARLCLPSSADSNLLIPSVGRESKANAFWYVQVQNCSQISHGWKFNWSANVAVKILHTSHPTTVRDWIQTLFWYVNIHCATLAIGLRYFCMLCKTCALRVYFSHPFGIWFYIW